MGGLAGFTMLTLEVAGAMALGGFRTFLMAQVAGGFGLIVTKRHHTVILETVCNNHCRGWDRSTSVMIHFSSYSSAFCDFFSCMYSSTREYISGGRLSDLFDSFGSSGAR